MTEVVCTAVFGGVEIYVAEHLRVEVHGTGIFGAFEHQARTPVADPEAPVIRVSGRAVFGGVEVKEPRPGLLKRLLGG